MAMIEMLTSISTRVKAVLLVGSWGMDVSCGHRCRTGAELSGSIQESCVFFPRVNGKYVPMHGCSFTVVGLIPLFYYRCPMTRTEGETSLSIASCVSDIAYEPID
jgi:hypothetical protein